MNATQACPKTNPRMGRIQKVSKILRAIMLAGLIVEGAGFVSLAIALPLTVLSHPSTFKAQIRDGDWMIALSGYGGLFGGLAVSLLAFLVTLNFFRLFTRLKDGHLFDGQTIGHLERAGKWWIAMGVVEMIYQVFESYISSPNHMQINTGDGIFGGLVIIFIAWVLREGQKLKEEQELTV
ncbi:MAG TPA: DUF2975 domain-containing protein [Verrucomicrobiae bacterium]|jgi:hypothetical protein